MARIGRFSNVGCFMIIEKPQKFFCPNLCQTITNPNHMGNKDMKSQPEQGRYRGAVPWAGLIFPAPSFLLHDYRELLIEHLRAETFVLKMKLQRKKTLDRVHARDLRQPTAFCSGAVSEWKGKCRLKAKWMGDVRDDEISWTSSKMTWFSVCTASSTLARPVRCRKRKC